MSYFKSEEFIRSQSMQNSSPVRSQSMQNSSSVRRNYNMARSSELRIPNETDYYLPGDIINAWNQPARKSNYQNSKIRYKNSSGKVWKDVYSSKPYKIEMFKLADDPYNNYGTRSFSVLNRLTWDSNNQYVRIAPESRFTGKYYSMINEWIKNLRYEDDSTTQGMLNQLKIAVHKGMEDYPYTQAKIFSDREFQHELEKASSSSIEFEAGINTMRDKSIFDGINNSANQISEKNIISSKRGGDLYYEDVNEPRREAYFRGLYFSPLMDQLRRRYVDHEKEEKLIKDIQDGIKNREIQQEQFASQMKDLSANIDIMKKNQDILKNRLRNRIKKRLMSDSQETPGSYNFFENIFAGS